MNWSNGQSRNIVRLTVIWLEWLYRRPVPSAQKLWAILESSSLSGSIRLGFRPCWSSSVAHIHHVPEFWIRDLCRGAGGVWSRDKFKLKPCPLDNLHLRVSARSRDSAARWSRMDFGSNFKYSGQVDYNDCCAHSSVRYVWYYWATHFPPVMTITSLFVIHQI